MHNKPYFHMDLYESKEDYADCYSLSQIKDYYRMQNLCIELDFDWIPLSVEFRKEHKKRDLSYADYLGYVIARELNIKFLTGDKEFEDLPNVEFVKK